MLDDEEQLLNAASGGGERPLAQSAAAEPYLHLQSYLRFRDLLEAAPNAIFEVDRDGTIVLLNATAEKMFGYQREELLGQLIEVLVPESSRQRHHEHRECYAEHPTTRPMGTGLELFARRKDGSEFPVEISLSPLRSGDGSRVMAIVRDITDRKEAEARIDALNRQFRSELAATNQQLEARNRELERANRLKSEFLASMSHELRTPLHTIIGFADLLAEELKGPLNLAQKRFVEHVQRDSRHLLELINDILDLSKIEAGRLDLHPELFKAADAIAETLDGLRPSAKNKAIDITGHFDRNLQIAADPVRFKEIVSNLVSNAIKFTPEGGKITIECSERSGSALFAVTDTGIGIPAAEQVAIFDKFYQLGSTTRGVREGTGLGLAITKRLVEMHGGTISVNSTPGEGSRFEVILPCNGPDTEAEQRKAADTKSGFVLLMTKDRELRHRIHDFLKHRGYEAATSEDAAETINLARQNEPAAILLDLAGLGAESFHVVRELRRNKETAHTPILALATTEDESTAMSLGASALVRKPVESHVLLQRLKELVPPFPGELSRVVVVDDDAEARELLEEMLRSAGHLPMLASSGKQALELVARGPVSAAVVDLMMPEMSGLELIMRMRLEPRFSQLPIIVLTGKELDDADMEVLSRQTNAVYLKASPWKEDFLAKIDSILQSVRNR